MKPTLFRIHSWLGLSLGLLLAVMGATGALMAFEDEITARFAPASVAPGVPGGPDLSPDALAARLEAHAPGTRVDRIDWQADRHLAHTVRMVPIATARGASLMKGAAKDAKRRNGPVDRASGAWRPEAGLVQFFATVRKVHRWLALPGNGDGPGRTITFLGALALLGFAGTGLALRWPRTRRQWRKLLVLDLRARKGRLRAIHRTVGLWLLPLYLLSALTGLWWGSDLYRSALRYALTGQSEKTQPTGKRAKEDTPAPWHADAAWRAFTARTGTRYTAARITMSADGTQVRIEALPQGARHLKQRDRFTFDAADGALVDEADYAAQPLGQRIVGAILEIHRGAFFGLPGRIALFVSSLMLPFFAISGLLFWWQRRPARRPRRKPKTLPAGARP
ncbi:PepSY domain-containing protein, partial [Novosphingobium sp. 1949]